MLIGVDASQDKQKGEKGRRRCSAGHGTRCDDGAPRGWRIGAHRDGAAKGQLSGQTRPAAAPRGQAVAAAAVTGVADLGLLGLNRPTGRHAGPLTGRLISLQNCDKASRTLSLHVLDYSILHIYI